MKIHILQLYVIIGIIQSGIALQCYKCPVRMKDIFRCSDPFENSNFQAVCTKEEDVCLKVSVRGSNNHLEDRGCANRKSAETICNRVRQNYPLDEVHCSVCETEFCNSSSQHEITKRLTYLLPLTLAIKMCFLKT